MPMRSSVCPTYPAGCGASSFLTPPCADHATAPLHCAELLVSQQRAPLLHAWLRSCIPCYPCCRFHFPFACRHQPFRDSLTPYTVSRVLRVPLLPPHPESCLQAPLGPERPFWPRSRHGVWPPAEVPHVRHVGGLPRAGEGVGGDELLADAQRSGALIDQRFVAQQDLGARVWGRGDVG